MAREITLKHQLSVSKGSAARESIYRGMRKDLAGDEVYRATISVTDTLQTIYDPAQGITRNLESIGYCIIHWLSGNPVYVYNGAGQGGAGEINSAMFAGIVQSDTGEVFGPIWWPTTRIFVATGQPGHTASIEVLLIER